MRGRIRTIGWTVASLLVVAACSGGAGASSPASGAASVGASVAPTASASADASAAATAGVSAAASSDAGSTGKCSLVSAEEVSSIVGVAVSLVEDDSTLCIYEVPATGAIVAYMQVDSPADAAATWAEWKAAPDVTAVTGVGDDALWQPANESVKLFVLKGDKMLSLAVGTLSGVPIDELPTGTSPDVLLDLAKQMGILAASRM